MWLKATSERKDKEIVWQKHFYSSLLYENIRSAYEDSILESNEKDTFDKSDFDSDYESGDVWKLQTLTSLPRKKEI